MRIDDLNRIDSDTLEADLVVVGGGPAGLTIARAFFGSPYRVIVVESGTLQETPGATALNAVEADEALFTPIERTRRREGHGSQSPTWSEEDQRFGVRCRVLGGSTQAWAGKAATFDAIDFVAREWVRGSGWPIGLEQLSRHIEKAAGILNLGPNVYDDGLWEIIGSPPPTPPIDRSRLRAFFWQFSRSRQNAFDAMHFGHDFQREEAENVRVLVNATVTSIETSDHGSRFRAVTATSLEGRTVRIATRAAVLAASAIENARLLLLSNDAAPAGLGNGQDVVGRYLIDHPASQLATFGQSEAARIMRRFGFQGVPHQERMRMYMHGLALSEQVQRSEGLLNAALFMLEDFAEDDPLLALRRLVHRNYASFGRDVLAILKSPLPIAKGIAIKAMQTGRIPPRLQAAFADVVVRLNPNFAVRETLHRGVQYRLRGVRVEGIAEQAPDPANRITLGHGTDRFGLARARIEWQAGSLARRTLLRLAQLMDEEFRTAGLPVPQLEPWVAANDPEAAPVIDMAHTMGTTRMSDDPTTGVVDRNCQVHGVKGLFVAGGSVFPTGGHSNPTLMIVALALRLAEHLQDQLPLTDTPYVERA